MFHLPERILVSYLNQILTSFLFLTLVLRIFFVFATDMNWDEFFYLSNVYDFERGDLNRPLQTIHVHAFRWLRFISENEVNQLIAARIVMYVFSLFTAYFIYKICRHFTSQSAAIFAVTNYCSFTFVIDHAASFRTDPIVTLMLMAALYIAISKQWNYYWFTLCGILIGFAGMVTIKAIFITPVIGSVMMIGTLQSAKKQRAFGACSLAFICSIASFGILYLLHKSALPISEGSADTNTISHGIAKTILSGVIFPQLSFLLQAVFSNLVFCIAFIFGVVSIAKNLMHTSAEGKAKCILLLSFCIPLSTLIFYRNTFPYFYPFIIAPASVLIAVGADAYNFNDKKMPEYKNLVTCVILFLLLQVGVNFYKISSELQNPICHT